MRVLITNTSLRTRTGTELVAFDLSRGLHRAGHQPQVGAAVILCDARGLGPMVRRGQLEELRRWNFGMRLLTQPLQPDDILSRIREFDRLDAAAVTAFVRQHATLEKAVSDYLQLYKRLNKRGPLEGKIGANSPTIRLRCRDQVFIRIKVIQYSEIIRPREEFYVTVKLRRLTPKPLATDSPWPTLLSYRWYNQDGTLLEAEGVRSLINPPVPWILGRNYTVRVVGPGRPGRYRLRLTLVQEEWRWLDNQPPAVFDEVGVEVETESRAFYPRG